MAHMGKGFFYHVQTLSNYGPSYCLLSLLHLDLACCLDPLLMTHHRCWPLFLWNFVHRCGCHCYWSAFQRHRHLLTPQYHQQNYLWYLLYFIYHLVHYITWLNRPMIYCILWYIFITLQIKWCHVPCFAWVPHWWCDLMVVSPICNQVAIIFGLLSSVQIASLHPPFYWYPHWWQFGLPLQLLIQWRAGQSITSHEFFSLSRVI